MKKDKTKVKKTRLVLEGVDEYKNELDKIIQAVGKLREEYKKLNAEIERYNNLKSI